MKLFKLGVTTKTTYTNPTKYTNEIVGTPEKWRRVREFITYMFGKTSGWKSFVGILLQIAITPIGVIVWLLNNTKHALDIDKKNHDENAKSNQAWPWIAMWCAAVVMGIMVADYRTDGEINQVVQNSIDNYVESMASSDDNDNSQIRFREFSGNKTTNINNHNNIITKAEETTITTSEETIEPEITEYVEETEACETEAYVEIEEIVTEESETDVTSVSESISETTCETSIIGGEVIKYDANGEIIWDDSEWNLIDEEMMPVTRSCNFE